MKPCKECMIPTANAKFCSPSCSSTFNGRIKSMNKQPHIKTCENCEVAFDYGQDKRRRFCSRSCACTANNRAHHKRGLLAKGGPGQYPNCVQCQKPMKSANRPTCSLRCRKLHYRSTYLQRWLQGLESGNTSESVHMIVREWLFETRMDRCEQCGWSEVNPYTGKIPLQAEHVDGDWRNTVPENLKLLCPSCHSLTRFYGGANIGNGRVGREEWRAKRIANLIS